MNTSKPHIVLLGDSIFDNVNYVPDGLPVIEHLRKVIPSDWKATLLAVDGDTTVDVMQQTVAIPSVATQLVVSVGGNDAIEYIPIFSDRVSNVGEALLQLSKVQSDFRQNYRKMLEHVLSLNLPIAVCTIYDSIPVHGALEKTALALFNDIILREAFAHSVPVIDLRIICNEETDYSMVSPIEPSHSGGIKIAKAIYAMSTGSVSKVSTVLSGFQLIP